MLPTNHVSNGFNCISQCTILQCSKPTEYFILFTGSFSCFFSFFSFFLPFSLRCYKWFFPLRKNLPINKHDTPKKYTSIVRQKEWKKKSQYDSYPPPILIIATFYQQHEAKAKPTGNVFSHIFVTYPNFSDFFIFPPPDLHFIIKKHIIPLLRNSMIFFFILFSSYARFYQYFILNAS